MYNSIFPDGETYLGRQTDEKSGDNVRKVAVLMNPAYSVDRAWSTFPTILLSVQPDPRPITYLHNQLCPIFLGTYSSYLFWVYPSRQSEPSIC